MRGCGCSCSRVPEQGYPTVKERSTSDQSLNQEPQTRPAVCERRKESLQGCHPSEGTAVCAKGQPLFVGAADPTSGGLERDEAALQPNRNGMRTIMGAKLREDICDVALDRRFPYRETVSNFFIRIPSGNQPQYFDLPRA